MLGQSGAIAKRPPHAAGSGSPMQIYNTDFTAVSTAATEVLPVVAGQGGVPMLGCWVTFSCTADCYIHFGRADLPAASSTNARKFVAGIDYDFWINDTEDAYFRVIRVSADGVLTRNRSNQ